jgi:hypothetical protein
MGCNPYCPVSDHATAEHAFHTRNDTDAEIGCGHAPEVAASRSQLPSGGGCAAVDCRLRGNCSSLMGKVSTKNRIGTMGCYPTQGFYEPNSGTMAMCLIEDC